MKKCLKNEKGFTLMEMIVVIVLVAIMAAVAIPLYSNYTTKGRASEANGILGSLVTAAEAWYQQYGSFDNFKGSDPWNKISKRTRYFEFDTGSSASAKTATLKAVGTGSSPNPSSGDTLTAFMADMTVDNPLWSWTATGSCTASK